MRVRVRVGVRVRVRVRTTRVRIRVEVGASLSMRTMRHLAAAFTRKQMDGLVCQVLGKFRHPPEDRPRVRVRVMDWG